MEVRLKENNGFQNFRDLKTFRLFKTKRPNGTSVFLKIEPVKKICVNDAVVYNAINLTTHFLVYLEQEVQVEAIDGYFQEV